MKERSERKKATNLGSPRYVNPIGYGGGDSADGRDVDGSIGAFRFDAGTIGGDEIGQRRWFAVDSYADGMGEHVVLVRCRLRQAESHQDLDLKVRRRPRTRRVHVTGLTDLRRLNE